MIIELTKKEQEILTFIHINKKLYEITETEQRAITLLKNGAYMCKEELSQLINACNKTISYKRKHLIRIKDFIEMIEIVDLCTRFVKEYLLYYVGV